MIVLDPVTVGIAAGLVVATAPTDRDGTLLAATGAGLALATTTLAGFTLAALTAITVAFAATIVLGGAHGAAALLRSTR